MLSTADLTPGRWVRFDGQMLQVIAVVPADWSSVAVMLTDVHEMIAASVLVTNVDDPMWELA